MEMVHAWMSPDVVINLNLFLQELKAQLVNIYIWDKLGLLFVFGEQSPPF